MTLLRSAVVYFWPWVLHAITCVLVAIVAVATVDDSTTAIAGIIVGTLVVFGPVLVFYPVAQYAMCHHLDANTSSRAIAEGPGLFATICTVWWILLVVGSFGYCLMFVLLGGVPLMLVYVGIGTLVLPLINRSDIHSTPQTPTDGDYQRAV